MAGIDRGASPLPGESRLAVVAFAALLVLAGAALVLTLVIALGGDDRLWSTVLGCAAVTVIAAAGLAYAIVVRRRQRRRWRDGDGIEPGSESDGPPGS